MLCDDCKIRSAKVHLEQQNPSGCTSLHLCEVCKRDRARNGQTIFLSNDELEALGWLCVSGRISKIDDEAVTIIVARSGTLPAGVEVRLLTKLVPESQRVISGEFAFCCPPEAKQFFIKT